MDLSVNGITFNGKREILYGLKKAATLSRNIEMSKKAYCKQLFKSKDIMMKEEAAAMRAYLDMVINDSEFVKTVNKGLTKNEVKAIKNIIKPDTTDHGNINPYDYIYQTALEVVKNKAGVKDAVEKLFSVLK